VDRIHQLDPNHPVLYRDAEDVYLPLDYQCFCAVRRQSSMAGLWRQCLYGSASTADCLHVAGAVAGSCTGHLGICAGWHEPSGSAPGFSATNGPEDLDRVFGLVEANGVPTDGGLAALSGAYLTETAIADATNGG
jgi:hypothetical protein